jgi:hypothetical protein
LIKNVIPTQLQVETKKRIYCYKHSDLIIDKLKVALLTAMYYSALDLELQVLLYLLMAKVYLSLAQDILGRGVFE